MNKVAAGKNEHSVYVTGEILGRMETNLGEGIMEGNAWKRG